jgi:hypothetical protein
MSYLTPANIIASVGVLILLTPWALHLFGAWLASTVGRVPVSTRREFERKTVQEILELKDRFEKHGNTKAQGMCRELLLAVVYADNLRDEA